jgi:hypothetical protein
MTSYLNINDRNYYVSLISKITPKIRNFDGIKIKHQILYITNFSKNQYLIKSIFSYFEWSERDIEVINKINLLIN